MKTWVKNFLNFPQRIMMRYLQKRGWVVFYLEEKLRVCNSKKGNCTCWLELYQSTQKEGHI